MMVGHNPRARYWKTIGSYFHRSLLHVQREDRDSFLNYDWPMEVMLPSHRASLELPPNHQASWRFASSITANSTLRLGLALLMYLRAALDDQRMSNINIMGRHRDGGVLHLLLSLRHCYFHAVSSLQRLR
jgi:hypothetical protein